jgi:hypothetical protein
MRRLLLLLPAETVLVLSLAPHAPGDHFLSPNFRLETLRDDLNQNNKGVSSWQSQFSEKFPATETILQFLPNKRLPPAESRPM